MILVTAEEMREMDRRTIEEFGLPGMVLMETAARGAFRELCRLAPDVAGRDTAVFAGKGNNGGDGYVMARCLFGMGARVTVYVLAGLEEIKGDAGQNLALLEKMNVPVVSLPDEEAFLSAKSGMAGHNVWIDAILGTGLSSPVRGYYREVVEFLNRASGFKFAVDMPSGLFSNTGAAGSVVKAHATATFGAMKVGQALQPGASLCGELTVVDIGIPPHVIRAVGPRHHLISEEYVRGLLTPRPVTAHKGVTGHVLVVAGSPGKTGAAAMAATSALRTGAGLATVAVPKTLGPVLETLCVEAMTLYLPEEEGAVLDESAFDPVMEALEGKRALALGPGIGTHPGTAALVRRLISESPVPVVADADALNALAGDPDILNQAKSPVILTPHPGEMARLTDLTTREIQADRVAAAHNFAARHKVHLALKGAGTVIAHPDGSVWINPTGNPGMASGGMGDVLTGVLAGLLAQGFDPEEAVRAGVYLHGLAADELAHLVSPVGYLATEVMDRLPETLDRLLGTGRK